MPTGVPCAFQRIFEIFVCVSSSTCHFLCSSAKSVITGSWEWIMLVHKFVNNHVKLNIKSENFNQKPLKYDPIRNHCRLTLYFIKCELVSLQEKAPPPPPPSDMQLGGGMPPPMPPPMPLGHGIPLNGGNNLFLFYCALLAHNRCLLWTPSINRHLS